MDKKIIILGAGPAGLSAGLELVKNGYKPIILEQDSCVGGICKTINYKGFKFDLGPHRFFTKSEEVKKIWFGILSENFCRISRLTRIYHNKKFFEYPIKIQNIIKTIGFIESFLIIISYLKQKFFPYKDEKTFERWVKNRFGKKLYELFFKNYTFKLWGIDPKKISSDWAAQRIKGMSIAAIIKTMVMKNKRDDIKSLIEFFWYPKYGAGQMYEAFKKEIEKRNGKIHLEEKIIEIFKNREYYIIKTNKNIYKTNFLISSIPITLLLNIIKPSPPMNIINATKNLRYRSIIEVNIILNKKINFKDNWIYLHDPKIKAVRLINYDNWSPLINRQKNKTPLGLEYFCDENDSLWNASKQQLTKMAMEDLKNLGFTQYTDYLDGFVAKIPKAYPAYFENYQKSLKILEEYLKSNLKNIQVIGRYGMFKYNNMDHSILTGLYAARNIIQNNNNYDIWNINIDNKYHEEFK